MKIITKEIKVVQGVLSSMAFFSLTGISLRIEKDKDTFSLYPKMDATYYDKYNGEHLRLDTSKIETKQLKSISKGKKFIIHFPLAKGAKNLNVINEF